VITVTIQTNFGKELNNKNMKVPNDLNGDNLANTIKKITPKSWNTEVEGNKGRG
jgi:hypothetical protein